MSKAYTVFELCITTSIIGIVLAISLPSISFINKKRLDLEADNLIITMKYLKSLAIATNKKQILKFDTKNNTYCYGRAVRSLCNNIVFGVKNGTLGPPSSPKYPIKSPITFKNNEIIFYPSGTISPGTVYLMSGDMVAISTPISQVPYIRKY